MTLHQHSSVSTIHDLGPATQQPHSQLHLLPLPTIPLAAKRFNLLAVLADDVDVTKQGAALAEGMAIAVAAHRAALWLRTWP